jgi:hypothetical protein
MRVAKMKMIRRNGSKRSGEEGNFLANLNAVVPRMPHRRNLMRSGSAFEGADDRRCTEKGASILMGCEEEILTEVAIIGRLLSDK